VSANQLIRTINTDVETDGTLVEKVDFTEQEEEIGSLGAAVFG
jgi:hypothetical protein